MSMRLNEEVAEVGPYNLTMWHTEHHEFLIDVQYEDRKLGTACVVIDASRSGQVETNPGTSEAVSVGKHKNGTFYNWKGMVLTPRLEQTCGYQAAHYNGCSVGWTWYRYIERYLKE